MIFRPSGGLAYHWRAIREKKRWLPFKCQVEQFLTEWSPRRSDLVLIGPSGGYTLTSAFLRRFNRVRAYDLDPLAPFFFRREHEAVPVEFFRQNAFAIGDRLDIRALDKILSRNANAAILFSNVLGQVLLENPATEVEWCMYLRSLRARLAERAWASYHDRFSTSPGVKIDHLTGGEWVRGLAVTKMRWDLTRMSHHEIDAVRVGM